MQASLKNALADGRAPGSWLILGNSDALVQREANAFLQAVFCETNTGCGRCPGCQKYAARTHTDLLVVSGKGVAATEVVPPFLAKRPFEKNVKAVLIEHVDLMTPAAQNALLKSVEEPPDDTVMVLCAVNDRAVLPTIHSRCLHVRAQPDTENALERLMQETQLPQEKAQILLRISTGDFVGARELHEKGYFAVRERAVEAASRLLRAKNKATSRIENLLFAPDDDLAFSLQVALIYLGDVLYVKYLGNGAPITNVDLRNRIEQDARVSVRRLGTAAGGLHDLMERMGSCLGLNRKLALQGALLEILEDIV